MQHDKICGKDPQSEVERVFICFYINFIFLYNIYDTLPYITPSLLCSESPNLAAQLLLR